MKNKLHLFLPLMLPLIVTFALSVGGGVASAASRPSLSNTGASLAKVAIVSPDIVRANTGASLAKVAVVSPNIARETCNSTSDYFEIWTDYDATVDCFAYAGTVRVSLYNADLVYTGNNTGSLDWHYNGSSTEYQSVFSSKNTYYWIAPDGSGGGYYVHVDYITIN